MVDKLFDKLLHHPSHQLAVGDHAGDGPTAGGDLSLNLGWGYHHRKKISIYTFCCISGI